MTTERKGTMEVTLDTELCCGYGNCLFHADDVFQLDDATGVARIVRTELPAARWEAVREAAADCPVSAIKITGAP